MYLTLRLAPDSPYAPGSLSDVGSKATFYAFQSIPELAVTFFLLGINLRSVFNTGPNGDRIGKNLTGGPRLRVDGILVDGVGVDPKPNPVTEKPRGCAWLCCRRSSGPKDNEKPKEVDTWSSNLSSTAYDSKESGLSKGSF